MVVTDGDLLEGGQGSGGSEELEDKAMEEEPDLTGLDSEPKTIISSVAILTITDEWEKPSGNGVFTRLSVGLVSESP